MAFTNLQDAVDFLLPLRSFPTRYLVLGLREWSLVINNMAGEHSFVDVLAIGRECGVAAITTVFREKDRVLKYAVRGKTLRWVESQDDGDRWHYLETGDPQEFEDAAEYSRKRKRDRLGSECLADYFRSVTGFAPPDWSVTQFEGFSGMERSTKDGVMPILEYRTARDLAFSAVKRPSRP